MSVGSKPILFNTEMVKAVLEGRKKQTRRIIKPQPFIANGAFQFEHKKYTEDNHCYSELSEDHEKFDDFLISINPYGQIGDRLWVRETWCHGHEVFMYRPPNYWYKVQDAWGDINILENEVDKIGGKLKWKPSIFMPRDASRITLEITDIRVEGIRAISEDDCLKEGIDMESDHASLCIDIEACTTYENDLIDGSAIKTVFSKLWDSINAKRGYSFFSNPWCWAISFKVVKS
jgi:hypothetical protein